MTDGGNVEVFLRAQALNLFETLDLLGRVSAVAAARACGLGESGTFPNTQRRAAHIGNLRRFGDGESQVSIHTIAWGPSSLLRHRRGEKYNRNSRHSKT